MMRSLEAVARELLGLFVDDGTLAVLALVWIAVAWRLLPLVLGPATCAALLFVGLAAGLAYSVLRA